MVYFYFYACWGHTLQYYVWFHKSENAIKKFFSCVQEAIDSKLKKDIITSAL